jgi:hypothetical protein
MLSDPLTTARRLAALGLCVIPVPRPRPGVPAGTLGDGKVPARPWGPYQRRRPTDAELVAWFAGQPMNLAVVTGAISSIIVIDADDPLALRWCTTHLPYTPWQTQTARGYHLWYRYPSVHVGNRTRLELSEGRLEIDVRGDGGYVIAPGSVHASGAAYQFCGQWTRPREDVPIFWPGWLERRPPHSPTRSPRPPRPTGELIERARRYLIAIPRPVIGYGSDVAVLSAACRLVRGFALSPAQAETLLWEWAGGRPGWTRDWIVTKVESAERYGTEPIGGLR